MIDVTHWKKGGGGGGEGGWASAVTPISDNIIYVI